MLAWEIGASYNRPEIVNRAHSIGRHPVALAEARAHRDGAFLVEFTTNELRN